MTVKQDTITLYRCEECSELSDGTAGVPLYECGECSTKFSKNNGLGQGHICPECTNKMGSRVADDCCAECEAGEVEELDGYHCPFCDEPQLSDDMESHLKENHVEDIISAYMEAEGL